MINSDFKFELSNEFALFGNAIYFSESPSVSQQLGRYICKFEIKLDEPVLDLNIVISEDIQRKIVDKFNELSGKNFETDIDENLYPGIQFGDILVEISEHYNWNENKHFKDLIKSFGYNSFKYFQSFHTDFLNKRGDYGVCYGLYNPKHIKFIDGPF